MLAGHVLCGQVRSGLSLEGMDSNLRFPNRSAPVFETVSHDGLTASRPGIGSPNPSPSSAESVCAVNSMAVGGEARGFAALCACTGTRDGT
jgi:hypothetical protein